MAATGPPPSPELIAYSNAQNLIAEAASLFSIAAAAVVLRCYVRLVMIKSFGHDDWTMVLSMLMSLGTLVCYVLQVPVGLGKHLSVIQLDPVKYQQLNKIRYVHQIICGPAVTVVKISVALFLLRFATRKVYRRFLWGLIVFLVAFLLTCAGTLGTFSLNFSNTIMLTITIIWACIPVEASWNYALRPPPLGHGTAKCFTKETFGQIALFNAVINCVTDFLLALLPIPLIITLKLTLRTRLSLIAILSLGIFAGAASIVRAMVFNTILKDPRRFIHDKYSMWNYVELNVGIVAGSLPALKPLFVRTLNEVRGRSYASKGDGRSGYGQGYGKMGGSGSGALGGSGSGLGGGGGKMGGSRNQEDIQLREYSRGNRSSATAGNGGGAAMADRDRERGLWNDSDESVVPLHHKLEGDLEGKKGAIVVTRGFDVK